jgi:hypothetical protein
MARYRFNQAYISIAFEPMNAPSPAPLPARPRTWPARLVQVATVLIVAGVAAATFVLSYNGVHAIALQSGVPADLARLYPAIFDAVLVIACAAAPLRAHWWTRCYTWLIIIVVVGLLGAMDAVHAMSVTVPHRQAAGAAAVLPWVLLLLAFSLWLAILRDFRAQHRAEERPQALPAPLALTTGSGLGLGLGLGLDDDDLADEFFGDPQDDGDLSDEAPEAVAAPPGQDPAGSPVTEVPGIPYATGPRLRRVRSLPAPPVEDSGESGDDQGSREDE